MVVCGGDGEWGLIFRKAAMVLLTAELQLCILAFAAQNSYKFGACTNGIQTSFATIRRNDSRTLRLL
jgi:hypothetical protein